MVGIIVTVAVVGALAVAYKKGLLDKTIDKVTEFFDKKQ